jgi:hypothetical protein
MKVAVTAPDESVDTALRKAVMNAIGCRKALGVEPIDPGGIEPLNRTKSLCVAGDQRRQ